MSIWKTDQLYLWDLSLNPEQPRHMSCYLETITFGQEGAIDAWGYLPGASYLYDIPDKGAHLQIVQTECGRPDIYENGAVIAELCSGMATKYIDGLEERDSAVILRVHVEGAVSHAAKKGRSNE